MRRASIDGDALAGPPRRALPAGHAMRGIGFMIASQLAFLFNDTLLKLASASLPLGETIVIRGIGAFALVAIAVTVSGQHREIRRLAHPAVWCRLAGEIGGTLFYLVALVHIPIATVIVIFQATPFAATAGAAMFLAERVGWRRWLAIVIGFAGVLFVVQPGLSGFEPYGLLVLISVLFVAFRDVATQAMPARIPTMLVVGATALVVTLLGAGLGLTETWRWPAPMALLQLCGAAALLFSGYYCVIVALRVGDMSVTAPFRYVAVVFAIAIGFLVWGDVPNATTLAGSAIIVATGIYMFRREAVLARRSDEISRGRSRPPPRA